MATKDYLDPRWQKVRLEIMERDSFQCKSCGSKEKALHVHHRAYEKGKRIWQAKSDDLVTLCEECHESVEQMVKIVREIGDKIAHLDIIGISPSPFMERVHDLVVTAHKKTRWGTFAFHSLDALLVSLIESSHDFEA